MRGCGSGVVAMPSYARRSVRLLVAFIRDSRTSLIALSRRTYVAASKKANFLSGKSGTADAARAQRLQPRLAAQPVGSIAPVFRAPDRRFSEMIGYSPFSA